MSQAAYRQIAREDQPALLKLFERLRPVVARLSNRTVYRAIIKDALASKQVVIYVASLDNQLIGYVIAAWNWQHFKRQFILRHPLVGFWVVIDALKAQLRSRRLQTNTLSGPQSGPAPENKPDPEVTHRAYAWEDSSPLIAKIIHVGVDPRARSQGVGSQLYLELIQYLTQNQFTRLDACIDRGNLASVRMHQRTGWTVVEKPTDYFAFIEMPAKG